MSGKLTDEAEPNHFQKSFRSVPKALEFKDACEFSKRKNSRKRENATAFQGFLPVLWPKRLLANSESEVFGSAIYFKKLSD